MFKCKVCISKDERIADLKKMIEDLRTLSLPSAQKQGIPLIQMEADAVLSGRQEMFEARPLTPEEEEAQREADRIFAGNYDTDYQ